MKIGKKTKGIILIVVLTSVLGFAFKEKEKPTVFIIGDSTVKNGKGVGDDGLFGWGDMLSMFLDTSQVKIRNFARGGRSSRTFQDESLWDSVMVKIRPGDYVLMQFGHNDGGTINTGKARGTINGNGDETQDLVMEATGKIQTIHTYGWYMRKYISDTKSKKATPIVISMVPRNIWKDGKVERVSNSYGKWAMEAANQEKAYFIDINELVAQKYEKLGADSVKSFFPGDHTHTAKAGAVLNALTITENLKNLKGCNLKKYVLPAYK